MTNASGGGKSTESGSKPEECLYGGNDRLFTGETQHGCDARAIARKRRARRVPMKTGDPSAY